MRKNCPGETVSGGGLCAGLRRPPGDHQPLFHQHGPPGRPADQRAYRPDLRRGDEDFAGIMPCPVFIADKL